MAEFFNFKWLHSITSIALDSACVKNILYWVALLSSKFCLSLSSKLLKIPVIDLYVRINNATIFLNSPLLLTP